MENGNGLIYKDLSGQVLGAAFTVHSVLGPGLLESACEGALCIEFRRLGIKYEQQRVYPLYYMGELARMHGRAAKAKARDQAGAYVADMVVEEKIILELKSVQELNEVMQAQLLDYLRLSRVPVGYLMNFNGTRLVWKRFVYRRE